MKALLVGLGGIGSNVYLPQLEKLGYSVTTVDKVGDADFIDVSDVNDQFDVAVICTPNFTHESIARTLATQCATIFIEKPGLPSADAWRTLCNDYPNTRFIMCKNNLYRKSFGALDDAISSKDDITSIEISWHNNDRVPNPGTWFTNKKLAWGGVALDLFPHLYCHLWKIAGLDTKRSATSKTQMWDLAQLSQTAYGKVDPTGTYNVADHAVDTRTWNNIPVTLSASWKSGVDNQSVRVHTIDSTYEWRFGLCPDYAYGEMIEYGQTEDYDFHKQLDLWIHEQLEIFNEC